MNYETITLTKDATIAHLTLNRPQVHNAINDTMIQEITQAVTLLNNDPSIRILILAGEGKSFCGGADLNWMKSMVDYSMEENLRDSRTLQKMFNTLYYSPKFLIGKITGHAFGGGLGLVAVCDLALAHPDLIFAFSETKLGLVPAVISPYVIQRIGPTHARHLFMTGERFTTDYAHQIGLIDQIISSKEMDVTLQKYIAEIHTSAPQAVTEAKKLITLHQELSSQNFQEATIETIARLRISPEGQEGTLAFLEKRKPSWRKKIDV